MMFSDSTNTCGSQCDSSRSKRSTDANSTEKITRWTHFYMNTDSPIGTGDHEHYFYYLNGKNRLEVLDPDGNIYLNCIKKAIHVRKKETHEPWWDLRQGKNMNISSLRYQDI